MSNIEQYINYNLNIIKNNQEVSMMISLVNAYKELAGKYYSNKQEEKTFTEFGERLDSLKDNFVNKVANELYFLLEPNMDEYNFSLLDKRGDITILAFNICQSIGFKRSASVLDVIQKFIYLKKLKINNVSAISNEISEFINNLNYNALTDDYAEYDIENIFQYIFPTIERNRNETASIGSYSAKYYYELDNFLTITVQKTVPRTAVSIQLPFVYLMIYYMFGKPKNIIETTTYNVLTSSAESLGLRCDCGLDFSPENLFTYIEELLRENAITYHSAELADDEKEEQ